MSEQVNTDREVHGIELYGEEGKAEEAGRAVSTGKG